MNKILETVLSTRTISVVTIPSAGSPLRNIWNYLFRPDSQRIPIPSLVSRLITHEPANTIIIATKRIKACIENGTTHLDLSGLPYLKSLAGFTIPRHVQSLDISGTGILNFEHATFLSPCLDLLDISNTPMAKQKNILQAFPEQVLIKLVKGLKHPEVLPEG